MGSAAEKNVMCAQAARASATHRTPRLLPPHLQYWKSSPRICHVPREHMALSCALRAGQLELVPPLAQQGDDALIEEQRWQRTFTARSKKNLST
jgi:hypothetical protein